MWRRAKPVRCLADTLDSVAGVDQRFCDSGSGTPSGAGGRSGFGRVSVVPDRKRNGEEPMSGLYFEDFEDGKTYRHLYEGRWPRWATCSSPVSP